MKLLQLPPVELRRQLAGAGVWLRTGPFSIKLQTRIPCVAEELARLYGQFEVRNPHEAFADFHVVINSPTRLRRWMQPQVEFSCDGVQPFKPLPLDQAFPMLESGLNWCISTQAHHYLILYAAAVEKNGLAAILLGPPGSGKSTLTAGLIHAGWRLLSDELTLIDRKTGLIQALPRPLALKNQTVDIVRQFAPDTLVTRASRDKRNDAVVHMCPPRESVRCQHETARPAWVVVPQWLPDVPAAMTPRSPAQTFMLLTQSAANYSQLGAEGFCTAATLFDQTACFDFQYSQLPDAFATFNRLADSASPA